MLQFRKNKHPPILNLEGIQPHLSYILIFLDADQTVMPDPI